MPYGHGKRGHIHPRTRSAYAASLVRGFLWDEKSCPFPDRIWLARLSLLQHESAKSWPTTGCGMSAASAAPTIRTAPNWAA